MYAYVCMYTYVCIYAYAYALYVYMIIFPKDTVNIFKYVKFNTWWVKILFLPIFKIIKT